MWKCSNIFCVEKIRVHTDKILIIRKHAESLRKEEEAVQMNIKHAYDVNCSFINEYIHSKYRKSQIQNEYTLEHIRKNKEPLQYWRIQMKYAT